MIVFMVHFIFIIGVEFDDGHVLPSRSYMDLGIFKGKSFKVGWQKGFNFLTVNNRIRQVSMNWLELNESIADPINVRDFCH